MPGKSKLCVFGLLTVLVVALSGCTAGKGEPASANESAHMRLPSDDVEDIVTYADQFSVFSVIAEREIEPPLEVYERGEGYLGREITIRIEDTLWSRGVVANAEGEIDLKVLGWVMHENVRRPIQFNDAPRLMPGTTYVGPLVWLTGEPFGDGMWVGYTSPANLEVENGRIVKPELDATAKPKPIVEALSGKSLTEVRQVFAVASPDPFSLEFSDLDPETRWRTTTRARQASTN
ncbi:MAG: hypothetical protein O3B95_04535 [Chloroflexi bacterium]|nr:hypothetical protein [Chloroflexota bacterium]